MRTTGVTVTTLMPGPIETGFAAAGNLMKKSRSYVSQYRRRALARYLIVATGYGKVAYTLPQFKEFILATQDPDTIYYQPVEIGG